MCSLVRDRDSRGEVGLRLQVACRHLPFLMSLVNWMGFLLVQGHVKQRKCCSVGLILVCATGSEVMCEKVDQC